MYSFARKDDRVHGPSRRASAVAELRLLPGHFLHVSGMSWQESSLRWARRCNLGVGGASALKSTSRSINNHLEQRDELFCNAEHDAAKATSFAESGDASHAARSGGSSWRR